MRDTACEFCIPVITGKVLTCHVLLMIIRYVHLIRRGECHFSLINKIIFITSISRPQFQLCFHFVSLVSIRRGGEKSSLSSPPVRGRTTAEHWVPAGAVPMLVPQPLPTSKWHVGFMEVSSPEDTLNHQDPSASYLSPGFSLNCVPVSEISICCGMVTNRIYPLRLTPQSPREIFLSWFTLQMVQGYKATP